jgi:YcaO-like protein with predicted kinase domain
MTTTSIRHRRGTHRVSSPEETRARIWPWLTPFGITRVANVTGLDRIGIPVVAVYRPNARSLSVAQGKGCTLASAEVSGVMESIEFHHAENISQPLLYGSYEQLRAARRLIDPEVLPRSAVGRWGPDFKVSWIEGVDLIQEETCWVPFELVHTDFTLPLPPGSGCFPMTSNGLASGNHLLEAVSHGMSEVIERDAATLFGLSSAGEQEGRRIVPATVDAPGCQELLARFDRAGVAVALFDMTCDTGVSVFRAVIADAVLDPERPRSPSTGTGCHPSRDIALSRALTEAAQSRLTMIAGSRDDLPRERYSADGDLDQLRSRRDRIFRGEARRSFRDAPTFEAEDIGDDVLWQKERLLTIGVAHVVVVDLTQADVSIPVVRVLIPELEPPSDLPGWLPGKRAKARQGRTAL